MSPKSRIAYLIVLFSFFIIYCVYSFIHETKEADNEKDFLIGQNFSLNGIIKKVMPLKFEDHGYGAIYLTNFRSNKGNNYVCLFKNEYLFCKINGNEAIIVTPGIREINPNDSVVYNTAKLSYKVYKNGKLYIENGTAINSDYYFYRKMHSSGYLDFNYYRGK